MENVNNLASLSHLDSMIASLAQIGIQFGLKLTVSVIILIIGMWLSNRLTRSVRRVMERRKLDMSLQTFLASFINIVLKVLAVIISLTTVGVQMTSIVAVLGAASLAVGMALSGTLQNFAGGIVILLFKPFKVGDSIIVASGNSGVVKKIQIFTTEVRTFDNQVVFLPNGALANGVITNLSRGAMRRCDLSVSIAYGDKVDVARRVILDILAADKRVQKDPAPSVFIKELGDSAVVLTVRFWAKYEELYATQADILERVYTDLPKKKVNFPFPQMDVHIVK